MHYVIGDIHGCYDDMIALISKIETADAEAIIYFVGDFIDRGSKVFETIRWMQEHITEDGKYQTVRGNHEQMAIEYIRNYNRWYAENIEGAEPEVLQKHSFMLEASMPRSHYDISQVFQDHIKGSGIGHYLLPQDLKPYLDFFDSLPYNKKLEIETVWGVKMIFRIVHAYYEHNMLAENAQHNSNLWLRMDCGNLESDEILVHGHTPTFNLDYMWFDAINTKPGMISYRKNDINIDGGCTFAKNFPEYPDMLCAIRLEDLEEIYPYTLEERYAQISELYELDYDVKERAARYRANYMEHVMKRREEILKQMGK